MMVIFSKSWVMAVPPVLMVTGPATASKVTVFTPEMKDPPLVQLPPTVISNPDASRVPDVIERSPFTSKTALSVHVPRPLNMRWV